LAYLKAVMVCSGSQKGTICRHSARFVDISKSVDTFNSSIDSPSAFKDWIPPPFSSHQQRLSQQDISSLYQEETSLNDPQPLMIEGLYCDYQNESLKMA
jgi:hypothetical protein